jgi:uncharacterized protein YndB with AHSA1/START domain
MEIVKDAEKKKIFVKRKFNAQPEKVWEAWTKAEVLDQWWAPKPFKTRTKEMDFREGGRWFYAMVGPDGSESWVRMDIKTVSPLKSFTAYDAFTYENGKINNELPGMEWKCEFTKSDSGTLVSVELSFASEEDMKKIVEMGFEEGFSSALNNLDEVL